MNEQQFPAGWDEQRVQRLIAELDARTEDEWVAADEAAAAEGEDQAVVTVPAALLPAVRRMLAEYDFSQGERGKYAKRYAEGTNIVVHSSDDMEFFPDSENVNAASHIKTATMTKTVAAKPKASRGAEQRYQQARRTSILLKHVSDPTRLQVILILAEGERHVGALCAQLGQSQPDVSHHLALLRHGGIIAPRRQGKNNFYSLTETGSDLARIVKNLIG